MSAAAARNHTKWVCFLALGAAALREKAEEEWNRIFPHQPWNVNNPTQISKLIQIEQTACNGKLSKPSLSHLSDIQNQGADFQNWDMTSLTYFLNQTRCLDLQNRDPQLFQATQQLNVLRNELAHMPDPFGVSDGKLRAVHQDFENALMQLSLSTLPAYKQVLKSIHDEPAPADFKVVIERLTQEKQETSSKNANLQSEVKGLRSSNLLWKIIAAIETVLIVIYVVFKFVKTPTFKKLMAILLRMI